MGKLLRIVKIEVKFFEQKKKRVQVLTIYDQIDENKILQFNVDIQMPYDFCSELTKNILFYIIIHFRFIQTSLS